MLSLLTEWNDAPGVKDPVLAATWARLEIKDESAAESKWLSRVIRSTTNSVDRGVYGSLFPLAEWIVENWWFLLHESCRVPEFGSGRRLASDPAQRAWVQRHNLLTAREGGALPDLSIFRDGDAILLKWVSDPEHDERVRPVRFVEQGTTLAEPSEVERSLHQFIEAVLERLVGKSDDSTERLRTNWKAVCESRQNESALCSWSASLGLDPYNENDLTDDLVEVMQSRLSGLPPELQHDLVDAATASSLVSDLNWLDKVLPHVSVGTGASNGTPPKPTTAHQLGYQRAALFRQQFSLPQDPISNLQTLLHDHCDWPAPWQQTVTIEGTTNVSALVGKDRDNNPRVVGPSMGHWAERFRLARSLYFLSDVTQAVCPRLVTRSYTWDQRASRAFAAELLAPAQALRAHVGNVVSADQVDRLARQFDVRPNLIEHQIRNHRLAWVDED
ncbi:MAG: ImmA/IrrE family metallo-endopeptidase, partial [Pirellulaceae bacterium]